MIAVSFQVITFPDDLQPEKFTSWVKQSLTEIDDELEQHKLVEITIEIPPHVFSRLDLPEVRKLINSELDRHSKIQRIFIKELRNIVNFQVIAAPDDLPPEKFTSWVNQRLTEINRELEHHKLAEITIEIPPQVFSGLDLPDLHNFMTSEINRHSNIQRIFTKEL